MSPTVFLDAEIPVYLLEQRPGACSHIFAQTFDIDAVAGMLAVTLAGTWHSVINTSFGVGRAYNYMYPHMLPASAYLPTSI